MMNRLRYLFTEANAPYYRSRPLEIIRLVYAKLRLSSNHLATPEDFLSHHQIDPSAALEGFDRWRPLLEEARSQVSSASGHQGGIGPGDSVILYAVTRFLRPDVVVETGVGPGLSTSSILAGLIENSKGHLFSIELPIPTRVARRQDEDGASFAWQERGVGWAIPEAIKNEGKSHHTLLLKDVRDALPELIKGIDTFDMFIHDDLHTPDHMDWEYELVWPHLKDGGLLVSDDVNWAWLAFAARKGIEKGLYLANLQRLAMIKKSSPAGDTDARTF